MEVSTLGYQHSSTSFTTETQVWNNMRLSKEWQDFSFLCVKGVDWLSFSQGCHIHKLMKLQNSSHQHRHYCVREREWQRQKEVRQYEQWGVAALKTAESSEWMKLVCLRRKLRGELEKVLACDITAELRTAFTFSHALYGENGLWWEDRRGVITEFKANIWVCNRPPISLHQDLLVRL